MLTPTQTSYRVLGVITLILSIPSLIGSLYILNSWCHAKRKESKQKNDLLNDYVAYMSMADIFLILDRAMYITNPVFKLQFMSQFPDWLCVLIGMSLQFGTICTATWNFVIVSFILIPLIKGYPMYRISKNKKYHLIFSFIMWSLCVSLPFFTLNEGSYGLNDNGAENYGLPKYQCWITNKKDYLCLYGFVLFYYFSAIIILLYTILMYRNDKTIKQLTSRLFWYSMAFILVWSGPLLSRLYTVITGNNSFILLCYHWISMHCVGWTNAAVWYSYIKPENNDNIERSESIAMSIAEQSHYSSLVKDVDNSMSSM